MYSLLTTYPCSHSNESRCFFFWVTFTEWVVIINNIAYSPSDLKPNKSSSRRSCFWTHKRLKYGTERIFCRKRVKVSLPSSGPQCMCCLSYDVSSVNESEWGNLTVFFGLVRGVRGRPKKSPGYPVLTRDTDTKWVNNLSPYSNSHNEI